MSKRTTHYTDYFGIDAREIPFEDLDAYGDTQLFLDPHAIRIVTGMEPYRSKAVASIDTFLQRLTTLVLSHENPGDILAHISEPKETHLGLADEGYAGHAGAEYLAQQIWTALTTDLEALLEIPILKHLEELPLFVKGIGNDITSDITTRIIFDALADFTQGCANQYPKLKQKEISTLTKTVWDSVQQDWVERTYKLPAIDGKPLVLIPKGWCRKQLLGSAKRFFGMGTLEYIQQEQSQYDDKGKLLRPSKKSLAKQQLKNIRDSNITTALAAAKNGSNIIEAFWKYVDEYYETHTAKAA